MEKVEIFKVGKEDAGKRLDVFLQEKFPSFSRSYFKNLIDNGSVLVDEKEVKSGEKLKAGKSVKVHFKEPEKISTEAENVPFEIVYEDDDLVVINKPQGLVVHPCSSTKHGTLVNGLLYRIKNLSGINGKLRPGIVHRLDKETSGLLVVAKNDKAHISLAEQIKNKTCKRNYLAILEGNLKEDEGEIETNSETLGDMLKEQEEFAVELEDSEYGSFIVSMGEIAGDDEYFWVYESDNNQSCKDMGMCPAVDECILQDEDAFTFILTNTFE